MKYDAIIVLSGGITDSGKPLEWTRRRLDAALRAYRGEYIIVSTGRSSHLSPPYVMRGSLIQEADAAADYLMKKGIAPEKILRERVSAETIGNAYFIRAIHCDPRPDLKNFLVITSAFHMPRSKAIFEWVFALDSKKYHLDFLEASDEGISEKILSARRVREAQSLKNLGVTKKKIKKFAALHKWLFTEHDAYATGKVPERASAKELKTY